MRLAELQALERDHVIGTYARNPVQFVRGQGTRLWDEQGDEYLVMMNDDDMPQLRLNPTYKKMLSKDGNEKDVRNYVKERYKSWDTELGRRVAGDPFPARVVSGPDLLRFEAGARPVTDATAQPSPEPPRAAFDPATPDPAGPRSSSG